MMDPEGRWAARRRRYRRAEIVNFILAAMLLGATVAAVIALVGCGHVAL